MNIQDIEMKLHEKAKVIKVDVSRLVANKKRLENSVVKTKRLLDRRLNQKIYSDFTKSLDKVIIRTNKHIESLNVIINQAKLDQSAIGICITKIKNARSFNKVYLNSSEFKLDILENYFKLMTTDLNYTKFDYEY